MGGSKVDAAQDDEDWPSVAVDEVLEGDESVVSDRIDEDSVPLRSRESRAKRRLASVDSEVAVESELDHQLVDEDHVVPLKKRISHGVAAENGEGQGSAMAKKLRMSESESAFWKAGDELNTFFYQPPHSSYSEPSISTPIRDTKTRKKLFTFRSGLPKLANGSDAQSGVQFEFHSTGPIVDELQFESGLPKELLQRINADQHASTEAKTAEKPNAHDNDPTTITSPSIEQANSKMTSSTSNQYNNTDIQATPRANHIWITDIVPSASPPLPTAQTPHQTNSFHIIGASSHQHTTVFVTEFPYGTASIPHQSPPPPSSVPTTFSFVNVDMEFLLSPRKPSIQENGTEASLTSSSPPSTSGSHSVSHALSSKPRPLSPFGVPRGRRKSPIWAHFVLQNEKYACRICKSSTVFSYSVTTRTLKKHIMSYHPEIAAMEPCLQEALVRESVKTAATSAASREASTKEEIIAQTGTCSVLPTVSISGVQSSSSSTSSSISGSAVSGGSHPDIRRRNVAVAKNRGGGGGGGGPKEEEDEDEEEDEEDEDEEDEENAPAETQNDLQRQRHALQLNKQGAGANSNRTTTQNGHDRRAQHPQQHHPQPHHHLHHGGIGVEHEDHDLEEQRFHLNDPHEDDDNEDHTHHPHHHHHHHHHDHSNDDHQLLHHHQLHHHQLIHHHHDSLNHELPHMHDHQNDEGEMMHAVGDEEQ